MRIDHIPENTWYNVIKLREDKKRNNKKCKGGEDMPNTGKGGSGAKGGTYSGGSPVRTGSKGSGGTGRSQGSQTGKGK